MAIEYNRMHLPGGCMAELPEVVAKGKSTRTITIEAEDAARVRVVRTVEQLCLGVT